MYKLSKDFLNPDKIKDINSYKWLAQPVNWPENSFEQYIENDIKKKVERNLNFNMIPEDVAKLLLWNNDKSKWEPTNKKKKKSKFKNESPNIISPENPNYTVVKWKWIYHKVTRKWTVRTIKK